MSLADLREELGSHVSLAEFHEVIKELARTEGAHVRQEADQKTLTDRDHRAAIILGGTARHNLTLDPLNYRRRDGRRPRK
ncbi:hypothetical protein AB0H71_13775 [Nocardia sp. NPDC050697]|uniref:hypothetical protein n=1 Tax=Nocardia sp. NPDC050697 TaxID=3155158 RepID=UPI00340BFF33